MSEHRISYTENPDGRIRTLVTDGTNWVTMSEANGMVSRALADEREMRRTTTADICQQASAAQVLREAVTRNQLVELAVDAWCSRYNPESDDPVRDAMEDVIAVVEPLILADEREKTARQALADELEWIEATIKEAIENSEVDHIVTVNTANQLLAEIMAALRSKAARR